MSGPEQEHIVGAFSFELGKCQSEEVKDRVLANLAHVDARPYQRRGRQSGQGAPKGKPARGVVGSPALSIMPSAPAPVAGRVIGILAGDGVDGAGLLSLVKALSAAGAVAQVIAPTEGRLPARSGAVAVDKSAMTTQSVEYDALVVAGGPGAAEVGADPYTALEFGRGVSPLQADRGVG